MFNSRSLSVRRIVELRPSNRGHLSRSDGTHQFSSFSFNVELNSYMRVGLSSFGTNNDIEIKKKHIARSVRDCWTCKTSCFPTKCEYGQALVCTKKVFQWMTIHSAPLTCLSLCNLEAAPEEAMQLRRLIKSSNESLGSYLFGKFEFWNF